MSFIIHGIAQAFTLLFRGDPETFSAIFTTLKATTSSICLSSIIGLPVGFVIGFLDFPGRKQLKVLFDTLLSLPTVVVGLVVYGLLSKNGPFGGYGLIYSLPAIIIAQTILILPIVIALTSSAIENADERMYIALKSYGLKGIKFFLATIYEIRIMIIMAIITAWARAFSEVGASIIVGGNIKWKTRTITTAIALEATRGNFARAIALGVVLLAIALLINILLHIYKKRV